MGIFQSSFNRLKTKLTDSVDFNSACGSAYQHCLDLTQHAFNGVFPYQLLTAAGHLHHTLTSLQPHPLIIRWVPSPPSRSQVDSALRATIRQSGPEADDGMLLGPTQFREWAAVLFAEAVVGSARKAVLTTVPIGIAGIVGVGAVVRPGKELIGTAIGVYALGLATSIYLGLSG